MNFKVRDTAWFIGVAFSVLLFMVGLFAGFFLSGVHVFFVNMLLFLIGSVTVLTGAGLLFAAAEVHAKLHTFKENPILQAHSNLYSVAVGEDRDSLNTDAIMNSLREDPHASIPPSVKPKTIHQEVPDKRDQRNIENNDTVFDIETERHAFEDEEINPVTLSKDELLAKIDKVQEIIAQRKTLVSSTPGLVPLEYPKTKPTIHEKPLPETSPKHLPDLKKIILIGEKGIDPQSERFKDLLVAASQVQDEGFILRLKGKTFGLGARGVRVVRKNTEFTAFSKTDINKMLKKFS